MHVTTRATDARNGRAVLLVIATEMPGQTPQITTAYWLYDTPEAVDELAADARVAFQALLERFAMPILSPEGRRVLFLPVITVHGVEGPDPQQMAAALGLAIPGPPHVVNSVVRPNPDGSDVKVAW